MKLQQQTRQKVTNLSRARDEEQFRIMELEQAQGRPHSDYNTTASWDAEIESLTSTSRSGAVNGEGALSTDPSGLPTATVLHARTNALRLRIAETRQAEQALKSRSRDIELKFRRLVALATKCSDADVDNHLDGLMRAVESEKGDLEIGRVRRFLGGVEGVVH